MIGSCKECKYWKDKRFWEGECRRRGPTVNLKIYLRYSDSNHSPVWPTTSDEDWCGDFEWKNNQDTQNNK